MKAAVITFPGSNCDDDCRYALARHCGFDVKMLWHKDSPDLGEFDLIALPGGFSYGDYLRCGAMASLSPIMAQVKEYAGRGGRVIGICNGFQILCESGLLPGALARNQSLRFVCQDVYCRVESSDNPWTRGLSTGEVIQLPIAHGDGRYVLPEAEKESLERNGQVVLRYSSASGAFNAADNPNGSMFDIAGVCNAAKNVFGLMPHPERATDLRSGDGMKLWRSIMGSEKTA
jgi:phosphoribosylformylglycinamidine synthase